MKTILLISLCIAGNAFAADSYVNPYVKKDGTVVQGYHRTTEDNTVNNNYGTSGNINPYTNTYGTQPRDNNGYGSYNLGNGVAKPQKQNNYGYGTNSGQ